MSRWIRLCALAVLCLPPLLAQAASARDQLRGFVADVANATGSFSQYTVGPQGETRPGQSGAFSFERPGKFKWAVQKPYEQLIVSDGKQIFQYDPDLAQVTVRAVDQAIGASPAAILFGSGSLEDAFEVAEQPDRDGLQWLRATPRGGDAGFSRVDIGMRDGMPVRIELLDAFGQTTRVELSGIRANPGVPAGEFRFEPPAGTDVVRM